MTRLVHREGSTRDPPSPAWWPYGAPGQIRAVCRGVWHCSGLGAHPVGRIHRARPHPRDPSWPVSRQPGLCRVTLCTLLCPEQHLPSTPRTGSVSSERVPSSHVGDICMCWGILGAPGSRRPQCPDLPRSPTEALGSTASTAPCTEKVQPCPLGPRPLAATRRGCPHHSRPAEQSTGRDAPWGTCPDCHPPTPRSSPSLWGTSLASPTLSRPCSLPW